MSLQDLGNIGEFLGGFAVLVSLVYVALQIKQNTTSVRAAASASVAESLARVTETLSLEPELGRIWTQGQNDYDSLDDDARIRFNFVLLTYMRRLENAFYQQSRGFLDPDHWQTTERRIAFIMKRPGTARWWSQSRVRFSDPFIEFVERQITGNPTA